MMGFDLSVLFLLVPVLWLGSIVWVIYDAEQHDQFGCLVAFLVAATGPLGLLIWILARPARKT